MTGVDSVIHVSSPTPLQRPDADDLMVKMAVDGVEVCDESGQGSRS